MHSKGYLAVRLDRPAHTLTDCDWVMNACLQVGSFAWGGMVGVHSSKILQHPRAVYEAIKQAACQPERFSVGFVMEHSWLMLFGGPNIMD